MAKAPTIVAGPASSNDSYTISEDQAASGTVKLNVRLNDNAKVTLYSLDDGQSVDLMTQDGVLVPQTSRLGASIAITADGQVSYTNTSAQVQALAQGQTLQDSFLYAVRMQNGSLQWQTVTVTISGTNDAPVARVDTATVGEDAVATGTVAGNDSDVDSGAVLTFATTDQIPAGFTMASNGSWAFDGSNSAYQSLAAGQTQQFVIQYWATDQYGASSSSTLTLTVTGQNDAPAMAAATAVADEDVVTTGRLSATDPESDAITFSLIGEAPAGFNLNADGTWALDGNAYQSLGTNDFPQLAINVAATDSAGAATASTLTITLRGANDAPVANPSAGDGAEDSGVFGRLTVSDADQDARLTYELIGDVPAGFQITSDFSAPVYWWFDTSHPDQQWMAGDQAYTVTVGYRVTDQWGASSSSTITATVRGHNDAPIAAAATATVSESGTVSGTVVAADPDAGAYLIYEPYYGGPDGFSMAADGSWTFDASQSDYGSLGEGESQDLVIDYVVTDDFGATSVSTLTITVTGENDAPTAAPATANVDEDSFTSGQVIVSDPDANDSLTVEPPMSYSIPGLEMLSDGSWTFDANQYEYQSLAHGETRDLVISYSVSDIASEYDYSTLTITITGTNDAPVTTSQWIEAAENLSTSGNLLAFDTDNGAALTFAISEAAPAGFALAADGSWTFDGSNAAYDRLAAGETQLIQAPFTVTDEHGASIASAVVVAVTGSNDTPELAAAASLPAGTEDTTYVVSPQQLLALWNDPDAGAQLFISAIAFGNGSVVVDSDSSYRFTPDPNFNGTSIITMTVSDGMASRTADVPLTIGAVNDPGVIGGTGTGAVTEATPFGPGSPSASGQLTLTDPDAGAAFTGQDDVRSTSGYGFVTLSPAGAWQYTLDNGHTAVNALNTGQSLSDSFIVTANDGSSSSVTIIISGGTDAVRQPSWYSGGGDPNDFNTAITGGNPAAEVWGTDSSETLIGTDVGQRFYALEGDDLVYGQGGNDFLYGFGGNDVMYGQAGEDFVSGYGGNNLLYGGSEDDTVYGGSNDDQLYGGSGWDSLYGFEGNDLLVGGYGLDNLTGGAGSDTFQFLHLRDTSDSIIDFVYGTDILDVAALDANQSAAGDQAFLWGGTTPGAYSLWAQQSTSNPASTILYADTDGNPQTAEFMLTLANNNFFSVASSVTSPSGFIL